MTVVETSSEDALSILHQTLLGELMNASALLVFVADDDMRYLAVSNSVCRRLGYTREEILKLRVPDVALDTSAAKDFAEMVKAGHRSGSATLRAKDGRQLDYRYFATETTVARIPFFVAVGIARDAPPTAA